MGTPEGLHGANGLVRNQETQDRDGVDMYEGEIMGRPYIGRRMLRMELPGKRKRGRPDRRFMDVVKEDMAEVDETGEDTEDRNNLRCKTLSGDH